MENFELATRTLAQTGRRQAIQFLGEQGIQADGAYKFVFHQAEKQYSVFAGSKKVAVIQEGTEPYSKARLKLVEHSLCEAPEKLTRQEPPVTDWSKFNKDQIWEIYQGLASGAKVAGFFNPEIPADQMREMRLAVN